VRLKSSVSLNRVQPQLAIGINIVESILTGYGISPVITSVNDSKHMNGSLHYAGKAADFRTHDWPETLEKTIVVAAVSSALGLEWDVVLEALGEDNEHMHVEWDPK
jgi:hypothetical protein